ncbi:alpha-N-arabinofuranosidase [Phenylobacterium montanum]|uniref:non-reducing end alpha-L-arabinofuranosidase n=1 Tax=Phenylobacterium montanum TaxID=2823693 RepID=A0A975IWY4_9CAUL|nr:alpha-L-arabinofuranosidase C-terminal domain-containing protein [Caulobacter sp. S6]QUD90330.1 alpha-N-arabinofuranosidase [Caulobacter sp. S6]
MRSVRFRAWLAACAVATMVGAASAPAHAVEAAPAQASLVLHADRPGPKIARDIYGQFSEHLGDGVYGGLWVGPDSKIPNTRGFRNDVVAALKALNVPVLRWPGGCFADSYHWRDGIGPRDKRPVTLNGWGLVEEPNAVGLHEFMDLAQMIGAQVYVNGNLGTGAPGEMADEVEYITSPSRSTLAEQRRANGRRGPWPLAWFAIGNEPWGCGGNMRPEYYADQVRQRAMFLRMPDDDKAKIIASGGQPDDLHWTETVMASAGKQIDGYTLHYYTIPSDSWEHKGSATGFDETAWISTIAHALRMDDFITRHSAVMDRYDPEKRVALVVDEWGNWYDPEPGTNPAFLQQQNTLRDAVTAALTLNIFHRHADRVRMAEIAQTVNVLQAMILTKGDQMVLTPSYHVFDLYRPFQDAAELPVEIQSPPYVHGGISVPGVDASAGRSPDGSIHLALVNPNPESAVHAEVRLEGAFGRQLDGRVLTAPQMDAANTFGRPDRVRPQPFKAARLAGDVLMVDLPAKSVVVLDLR